MIKVVRTWNQWRYERTYIPLFNRIFVAGGICGLVLWAGIGSGAPWWLIMIACVPWQGALAIGMIDDWREWDRLGRPATCCLATRKRISQEHGYDERPTTSCCGGK